MLRFAPYGFSAVSVLALAAVASRSGAQHVVQSERHAYHVETVVEGLSHPWGMAFLPNGDLIVTERVGRLRLVRGGKLDPQTIQGVPAVRTGGQAGLMDVALHPNFATNRLVYLSYSKPGLRGATTAVIRGRFDNHRLADVQEIFVAKAWSYSTRHFGSRMAFDRNGFLFITVGERGSKDNAQKLSNHNGKHIRLHDDGRVPRDNPFIGKKGALPEIFSYGNRNPQGLALHPVTGELWSSEHGPMGGDEINVIQAGRNYGWPAITYGIDYNGRPISDFKEKPGMEQPQFFFLPSIGTSGLAIYNGDAFPNWRGDVFVGGLVGQHLARIHFRAGATPTHEKLNALSQRIRDVRVGPDGLIYLLTDAPNGRILRLSPTFR